MENNIDICADLITPRVARSLIPAFITAYGLATIAANDIDFLGGELKGQIMPHLRNWAIEYELNRRAHLGSIPFTGTFENNSRKNHRHLELRHGRFLLTISQTHRITDLPRDCVFRNEHCLNGQLVMEEFDSRVDTELKNIYAILTHGHGIDSPGYILCGIPSSDMKSWVQAVNLYDVVGKLEVVDKAPITEEVKLGYRETVKEKLFQG